MTEPFSSGEHASRQGSRILRAGALIALAHICLKFVSPLQYMLIGHLADEVTRDLFIFGFEGVLLMLFFVGEESLGPALLPVFMQEREDGGEKRAWQFANSILTAQFVLITLAVVVVAAFPHWLANLTAWNEPGRDPRYMQLAPLYARYMVLGLFGLSLGSTTYMLLNGYKRFFLAAFGDAAVKIGLVMALSVAWLLHYRLDGQTAVLVFAVGCFFGSVLKLGTHLIGLRDKLTLIRPQLNWRSPACRQFMLLVAPLLAGIMFAKVRDIYNNILVLSVLPAGVMSATAFGRKIYESIRFLGPYSVSVAMLPFFCEMVARRQREQLGQMITHSSRLIVLMCMPLAALIVALSLPIARVLFQSGNYDYQACLQAAVANAGYTLVLPFAALECVFMQMFFADRRMLLVTSLGILFSFFSMLCSYIFVIHLGWRGLPAIAAVSLAFTLSRICKVAVLALLLRRQLPCFPAAATLAFLARIIVVSVAAGVGAWVMRLGYSQIVHVADDANRLTILLRVGPELVLGTLGGATVALLMLWWLCRAEMLELWQWFWARLQRLCPALAAG